MRKIMIVLTVLLVLASSILSVAAHDVPDLTRKGSITVVIDDDDKVVPGGSLLVYKVGQIFEDDGNYGFELTKDFAASKLSLADVQSRTLAKDLDAYVKEKNIKGTGVKIGKDGKAKLEDMELGLYLVMQDEPAPGYYPVNSFLIALPTMEDGEYRYDVDGSPKVSPIVQVPPTTEPEEPMPTDPQLPQTGAMNWPVPLMCAGSIVLIGIGLSVFFSDKRKQQSK